MKRRSVFALAAASAVAACDSSEPTGGTEKVTYLTGVGLQGREGYVHTAVARGWYADAGFDVEIRPGNGTEQNLQLLSGGCADFAVVDITAALVAYGKQGLRDFVVVAGLQQRTLACIMALEGGGIAGPADLAGRKIAYIPGGVVRVLYEPWARLAGAPVDGIEWVTVPAAQLAQALAAGTVDAISQFVVGQPGVEAAAQGRKAVVLRYGDTLPELYGNGLAVRRDVAERDPKRVRRFAAATAQGLAFAAEHPDQAAADFVKQQTTQQLPVATAELTLLAPYVAPAGALDAQRAQQAVATLVAAGAVPATFDPAGMLAYDLAPKG